MEGMIDSKQSVIHRAGSDKGVIVFNKEGWPGRFLVI